MSMMGELNFFFELKIRQTNNEIFISQSKYRLDMLKRFEMENLNPINTPMSSSIKLDKDVQGTPVNVTKYRGMIGSLLYLIVSRQDIMFNVCLCARFQSNSKKKITP